MATEFPPGILGVPVLQQMWSKSAIRIFQLAQNLPRGSHIGWIYGSTSIPGARTEIAEAVLADPAMQWLCFCDADATPKLNSVNRLLRHDVDIVSASYYNRSEPHQLIVEFLPGARPPIKNQIALYEANAVGTHFVLIRRHVFEVLGPEFSYRAMSRGFGEDYEFCHRARDAGFQVWLDCTTHIGHISVTDYGDEEDS